MKFFSKNLVFAILALFSVSRLFADNFYSEFSTKFQTYLNAKNINYQETAVILEQVYNVVSKNYVLTLSDADKEKMLNNVLEVTKQRLDAENSSITNEELSKLVMSTLLKNLDKHSVWLSAEEANTFNSQLDGSYKGIGIAISVDKKSENILVAQVYKGSNADLAGIKAGDIILKVDNIDIEKGNTDQAALLIRGKQGTYVKLAVERVFHNGEKVVNTFEVKRDVVNLISSEISFIKDDILYIDIDYFNRPVLVQFNDFFAQNEKPYKAVIIDLRDNPGGLFYETIQILNAVIDDGVVVSVKIPEEKDPVSYVSRTGTIFKKDIPIIVLVNEQTASSAEIFAAALQDNAIATIMGANTYGKGSIQTIFDLSDNSALKITTELFYTPSQYSIQGQGVVPNIAIINSKREIEKNSKEESSSIVIDKEFRKTEVKTSNSLDIDSCTSYKGDSFLGCAIDYLANYNK